MKELDEINYLIIHYLFLLKQAIFQNLLNNHLNNFLNYNKILKKNLYSIKNKCKQLKIY